MTLNYEHLVDYTDILLRLEDAEQALFKIRTKDLLCHPELKQRHGLLSRIVSLDLLYDGILSEQALQVWYPSVTPQLSPACRGQNMWTAAECLFTGEAGHGRAVRTESEPVPTPHPLRMPAADHSSSLLFFSSASPKDRLTTSHFFWTRRLCRPLDRPLLFPPNGKIAGALKTAARAHEWMETGTLSTI